MKESKQIQKPDENEKNFSNTVKQAIENRIKPLLQQPVNKDLRKPKADKGV